MSSRPATDQRPSFGSFARTSSSSAVAGANARAAAGARFAFVVDLADDGADDFADAAADVDLVGAFRCSGMRSSASAAASCESMGRSRVTVFGSWPSSIPLYAV